MDDTRCGEFFSQPTSVSASRQGSPNRWMKWTARRIARLSSPASNQAMATYLKAEFA
jgi:hypothetical protein